MVSAHAEISDDYEFGEWHGRLDPLNENAPIALWADNWNDEELHRLWITCTPDNWEAGNESVSGFVTASLLAFGSDVANAEGAQCQLDVKGWRTGVGEQSVSEQGPCVEAGFMVVQERRAFFELLHRTIDIRMEISKNGDQWFTFVAPHNIKWMALDWLNRSCSSLQRVSGGILAPGPRFEAWNTRYKYDTFHEGILIGSIETFAFANETDVVKIACDNAISVVKRSDSCLRRLDDASSADFVLEDCAMLVKSGNQTIQLDAYCAWSDCMWMGAGDPAAFVRAMLGGNPSKLRLVAPSSVKGELVRDLEVKTNGLQDALDWIDAKCTSDELYRPDLPGLDWTIEHDKN